MGYFQFEAMEQAEEFIKDYHGQEFVAALAEKGPYEAPPNPIALLKPASNADTPLLNYMKQRVKDRRERFEKQKKKWKPSADTIDEDPKKAKWYCTECGTTKNLEEDPDDRGTFYCTYCWESWESELPKAKPKKKKKKDYEEEYYEEEVVEETKT